MKKQPPYLWLQGHAASVADYPPWHEGGYTPPLCAAFFLATGAAFMSTVQSPNAYVVPVSGSLRQQEGMVTGLERSALHAKMSLCWCAHE